MNNVKKNIMIFGAVVIAMLMVSSATAVTIPPSNKIVNEKTSQANLGSSTSTQTDEIYVDPQFYLTNNNLPMLYETLKYLGETNYYGLVGEIINEIERDGSVDSNDMKKIIEESDVEISSAYGPCHIKTNPLCDGRVLFARLRLYGGILPRVFLMGALYDGDDFGSNGDGWHLTINGINQNVGDGLIIGFTGCIWNGFGSGMNPYFGINGFALIVFHTNTNQNIQSGPSSAPQSSPTSQTQPSSQSSTELSSQPSEQLGSTTTTQTIVGSATPVHKTSSMLQHIDSNIIITSDNRSELEDAYEATDNEDFKTLLGDIISLLDNNEVVTSSDIENIIDENELNIRNVYFMGHVYTEYDECWYGFSAGDCGWHIIRPFYWGLPFRWNACQANWPGCQIKVMINQNQYFYDHQALVVSYFGYGINSWTFDMQHGARCKFNMGGFGFLILIA